ncbi:hypothetical protein DES53_102387 [Roseimicrobium gellanilyticum]|uniref:DUF4384 domain-containing protein n=1 Tax=Roseimicrobium gellanilyticum TaxID=748857 RepID=A0A366HQR6_9BACT|nr:hypothetical protein [Roseimicrobium gellanilyticum]RBP46002.1 hypothetical protein DES53_102387 [Roseimicrobium gellanilyticum]
MMQAASYLLAVAVAVLLGTAPGIARAQQVPAKQPVTAEQLVQTLEEQLKYVSTLELKWKLTLVRAPMPKLADKFAEDARKLQATSPSSELEAKRLEMEISNAKSSEKHYRQASLSYAVWALRCHGYAQFYGSKHVLDDDKLTLRSEYVGEVFGQHRIIEHSSRSVDLTSKSNVLYNTLSACPPLAIIHILKKKGSSSESKASVVSQDDSNVEVTFPLQDSQTLRARFTLPHYACSKLTVEDSNGKVLETMESSAPWKTVPGLPFQPAVWTHSEVPMQRTWEFLESREVGPEGYKDFKEPIGYRTLSEEEGIP